MVKKEFYDKLEDGTVLYISYSDINKTIIQKETGYEYERAIDTADENGNIRYTYEETEKEIEREENYE